MKEINTKDAVGHVLCHDITQIVKDKVKGVAFKKGHVVKEEDIEKLLSLGKDHLYVWEKKEGMLHENEAAMYLRDICKNDYMEQSDVKEGKIELSATIDGLLKVDVEKLRQVNALGEMMIATRHGNTPIKRGDKLAGTRIIPLIIEEEKMKRAKELCKNEPILSIKPYVHKKVGIVTTGNEVYYGRIKDTFGPVVMDKVKEFGAEILGQTIVNDNPDNITKTILDFIEKGAVRIGFTKYTDRLDVTAFKKDNKIAVVMLNRTEEKIPAYLRLNGYCAEMEVEPNAIATAVIEE